jgi:hypothetical protein
MTARTLVPLRQVPEHRPWVTERWLRRAVFERRIPFHKLGEGRSSPVLIDLADLDAFVEAGRIGGEAG